MENRREGFTLLAPLPLLQQNEFKSLFKSTLLHACVTELWLSERVGGGGRGWRGLVARVIKMFT